MAGCGNKTCDPCETGIPDAGDKTFYCAIDCGWCGDGLCGAGDKDDKSGTSYCEDCPPVCGNNVCEPGETPLPMPDGCPADCGTTACGNGICEWSENPDVCGVDCGTACGNGLCEKGESPQNCDTDCSPCGDGMCSTMEAMGGYCAKDCALLCGDGTCDAAESVLTCPADCAVCEPNCTEKECGADGCGGQCGDCEPWETCSQDGTCESQGIGLVTISEGPCAGSPTEFTSNKAAHYVVAKQALHVTMDEGQCKLEIVFKPIEELVIGQFVSEAPSSVVPVITMNDGTTDPAQIPWKYVSKNYEITLDEFGFPGEQVKGAFSGTLEDQTGGGDVVLTGGVFDVPRVE
jgi:hypothetical protein